MKGPACQQAGRESRCRPRGLDCSSVFAVLLLAPSLALGQAMTGASGTVFADVVDNGGSVQSSASYNIVDSIGETAVSPLFLGTPSLGSGFEAVVSAAYPFVALPPQSPAVLSVSSTSLTLAWSSGGNPNGTQYQVDYWTQGGSTYTLAVNLTTATVWGLAPMTTYYLAVQAVGSLGLSAPTAAVSTVTAVSQALSVLIGPEGGTIVYYTPDGPWELDIPPGCFTQMELVTLSLPAGYPAEVSAAARLTGTGIGLDVDVSPYVLPLKEPRLRGAYSLGRVAGFNPATLIIARYDTGRQVWVPYATSVDQGKDWVIAMLNHFSTYQIMSSAASGTVDTFKAFPNPLRPALGQLFMTFSLLPPNARVRIYTLTGVLVRDTSADAGGVASWDGTNQAGGKAASGVYFVLVQGEGQTKTFEVAVQR